MGEAGRGLIVIRRRFEAPQIRAHRLLAAGGVFLRLEGGLVGCNLADILRAGSDGGGDSTEALTLLHLRSLYGRGTHSLGAQIQAVAVRVGGLRYAVRSQQHLGAAVLTVLTRFTECTGYTVNTGAPIYMCHFVFGVCRTDRFADRPFTCVH